MQLTVCAILIGTTAIDNAYNTAELLHRDISVGNIMVTANGRGILNDWDHAGPKNRLAPGVVSTYTFGSFLTTLIVDEQGNLAIHVVRATAQSGEIA